MINEAKAKLYCKEDISKIKNYDKAVADTTQTWICHHRTAIWWNCSAQDLIENECYYGRKACELEFMTPAEHKALHGGTRTGERNPMYGKSHSDETRRKIGEANKGKPAPNKGKTPSDATRQKISDSMKGKPAPNKGKPLSAEQKQKLSAANKGKTNPTKGKTWKLVNGKRVWFSKDA